MTTTSRLTKGMYGHEFNIQSTLFGLWCGQIRGRDLVHNGGWFNAAGEKLGWGDLSVDDFMTIRRELQEGELFIILSEQDSFWKFVERPGIIGSMAQVKPDVEAPGTEYVAENAMWIIAHGTVYHVERYGDRYGQDTWEGLVIERVSKQTAADLIARHASVAS